MSEVNIQKETIEIKGIAPLFQVFDMPASLSFYRDKLGFEIKSQSQQELGDDCDWALLRLNGVELMLNTAYEKQDRPAAPDLARISSHADTSIYFGCPDIDSIYNHLREKGVEVKEPGITSYGFKVLYLTDPDGYGLCFHWPAD